MSDQVEAQTHRCFLVVSGVSQYFEPIYQISQRWFGLAEVPVEDATEIGRLLERKVRELTSEEVVELRKKKVGTPSWLDPRSALPPSAPNTNVPAPGTFAPPAPVLAPSTTGDLDKADVVSPKSTGRKK